MTAFKYYLGLDISVFQNLLLMKNQMKLPI